ncbi:hypothetical protein ASPACDRAFT_125918 [Aspergillus aculeatus ATCC 16872]|uniref:Uncharacterized protein n=1 Tax=Aspergillus aculeatus (strain ATCC 16872 / CBS 172.66 / WB 5094) TaxID=690307 RepID=A0A1L9WJM2_ASPA1|nr:uncharacterized protein ASPACDRAFT_125918 [Aspergillus aculeatus ATCC 16872]OJJ96362.1 hypothetical protein ASPACDRAFT_125918 [Aspergillus aculeatus ATCC 16872]
MVDSLRIQGLQVLPQRAALPRDPLQQRNRPPRYPRDSIQRQLTALVPLPPKGLQLISVYFPAPVAEPQRAQIQKLKGYRPPALRFHAKPDEWDALRGPVMVWAAQTERRSGQEVQLMLWPHFWRDADRAERRLVVSVKERFERQLGRFQPVEWGEEFLEFELVPCI